MTSLALVWACILSALPVVYLLLAKRLKPKPFVGIPHHPVTSIWGDLPAVIASVVKYGTPFDTGSFFQQSADQLGPVYQVFFGPFKKAVVVSDFQECEDFLLRSGSKLDICDIQVAMFQVVIPQGLVALPTGSSWRRHKRAIAPLTAPLYVSEIAPIIGAGAFQLVNYWSQKITVLRDLGGTCFTCKGDFEYSSLDIISHVIAGQSLGMVEDATRQLAITQPDIEPHGVVRFATRPTGLYKALRKLFTYLWAPDMAPGWALKIMQSAYRYDPRYRSANIQVQTYIGSCLERSRQTVREARAINQELPVAKSMCDIYAQAEESEEDPLPESEFRDEIITMLFGGHDTTSVSLQWGLKFLSNAPHVQRRLRAELMSKLEDAPNQRSLTHADLNSTRTPYLDAVTSEIQRHARMTIQTWRKTLEPVTILGNHVPANVDVFFNLGLAAQREEMSKEAEIRALDVLRSQSSRKSGRGGRGYWVEPNEFNPDRWIDTDGHYDPKAGYSAPFSLGIRACPGRHLARIELKAYIATLNLAFYFDKVPIELDNARSMLQVTRPPEQAFIKPRLWDDI